jgi:RNA polymerase sigma factor (sigma-70 family)
MIFSRQREKRPSLFLPNKLKENTHNRGISMSLEPKEAYSFQANQSQTALYERYSRIIFGYLRLHIHSPEDAEDLLLDVFLAALEHDNLAAFSPGEQLAWLRRVAHNKLINTYRRASRSPHTTLNTIEEPGMEEESPEYLLLQQEAWQQVQTSLKSLPALQQHILQLRYGDGLRCSEIALLLNKREEAVRKLLSRSILRLRQIYQQIEGESTC